MLMDPHSIQCNDLFSADFHHSSLTWLFFWFPLPNSRGLCSQGRDLFLLSPLSIRSIPTLSWNVITLWGYKVLASYLSKTLLLASRFQHFGSMAPIICIYNSLFYPPIIYHLLIFPGVFILVSWLIISLTSNLYSLKSLKNLDLTP